MWHRSVLNRITANMSEDMEKESLLQNTDSDNDFRYTRETKLGSDIEEERNPRINKKTFEEAITATGYGKFHYRLLALCGWSVSSDAIEILSISFILPPATCDMDLSDSDKGWINSSVFIGMMIGSYLWGALADIHGRRAVLIWSLAVNALGGLCSSFAQVKWLFILMRLISGIGVGGSMPVIFTYFTEFQPKDKRGAMISVLATFWMCGNILAAGLAWIIIPQSIHLTASGFTYDSWRLFLAICTLPSATSAVLYVIMPESPKYLYQKGKELDTLRVLQRMFRANRGSSAGEYEVEALIEQEKMSDIREISAFENDHLGKTKYRTKRFFSNTVQMFKAPLTSISIVMSIIYFTLSFGYYGLYMWFPELFAKAEMTGGAVCSSTSSNASQSVNVSCEVPSNIYVESFLTAISNLPGNILTIFLIDRIGRKIPLVVSMLVSGVSVFFIYFLHNKTQMIIMSCLFSGISVIGWNALDVLLPELYPTELRSTSSGLLLSIGRIAAILGNQVFGQLVSVNCAIPMLMVVLFLGIGGLSAIKLPNMTKQDLL